MFLSNKIKGLNVIDMIAFSLFYFILTSVLCSCSTTTDDIPIERSQSNLLSEIIQTAQQYSLNTQLVDWAEAQTSLEQSLATDGFNRTIELLLELLDDQHSFYILPNGSTINSIPPDCTSTFGDISIDLDDVGYIKLNPFAGQAEEAITYAANLQSRIKSQDSDQLKGWVIDLSDNSGGNLFAMITGVAPFLGEGIYGYFVNAQGAMRPWGFADGGSYIENESQKVVSLSVPYFVNDPNNKVAIITDRITASSGEAALISFLGESNIRTFGRQTCGLSTFNEGFNLSDGSSLVLTTSAMADRDGVRYGAVIAPDETFSTEDEMIQAVEKWILD